MLASSLTASSPVNSGTGADRFPFGIRRRLLELERAPVFVGALALVAGLVHVALIAPHYFVGSFDDDASYVLSAKALLDGQGLTGHIASGAVVAGVYPPGYSALLAPLVWLWPHSFVPLRILSGVCYAAVFPLTWVYLRRRGVRPWVVVAALWVIALGPPFATFGSMVMAETPFLVLFLAFLLLVERWDRQRSALSGTGLAVVLCAAGLVWLKEAALGMAAGLALWELFAHRDRYRLPERVSRGLMVALGTAVLLVPVVVARVATGVPVAGSRYSQELGGYYSGGLGSRLVHVVPHGLWQMISTAIGATLVPYLSPLPSGHISDLWKALTWHVSILAAVGAVVWFRRHRDAAVVIVPVYLAETSLWPYVNERRVILALPVVAAWYVIGASAAWRLVAGWIASHRQSRLTAARRAAVVSALVIVVVPLAAQIPRDYLFNTGQSSSHFDGSRYAAVLSQIGPPSDPVETDYLYSTALFTGHRTVRTAFNAALTGCYLPGVEGAIASDNAGFLLLGDLNKPGVMDSPCLLEFANSQPWAVRLLHTTRDDASAYELIGPGTAHPDVSDAVRSSKFSQSTSPGSVAYEWSWSAPVSLQQVSVGAAGFSGPGSGTSVVTVEVEVAPGTWRTVARAASGVGDGAAAPFLLVHLAPGVEATAVRLVAHGQGPSFSVADVHALASGSRS